MSKNSSLEIYSLLEQMRDLMNNHEWDKDGEFLSNKLNSLENKFFIEIENCNEIVTLEKALNIDEELILPFDVMKKLYEKLITLTNQDKNILENYAKYLLLHGPDWDNEANEILKSIAS